MNGLGAPFAGQEFAAALPWTIAAVVAALAITFVVAVRVGRHAVIDVTWGLGFVAIAWTSFLLSGGEGDPLRRVALLVAVTAWGVRLAAHIANRSRGHGEDPRYEAIMRKATGNPDLHMLRRVYLTQGAIMWFVSLPVQVAMFSAAETTWLFWVGLVVFVVGLFFETVGDYQLHRFRSDPDSAGKVLDTGLWRYTRHPNYFGDACAWWGIFLMAADGGIAWLTILSPVVMNLLLAKGTGKPLLEKDMAGRRPEYVAYVRRTSGFVPWFPKKDV